MVDIIQKIIGILKSDATLASLMNTSVPILNLFTGPVDIVKETQSSLGFPILIVSSTSESFRTVPQGARDSRISIDIWSRNSEKEVLDIYERVAYLINFTFGDINSSYVFWQRGEGFITQFESEVRLWHQTFDIIIWSI
jgi:hypothetical protein